jgi:tetratricopeptide (TPR) repeat protein
MTEKRLRLRLLATAGRAATIEGMGRSASVVKNLLAAFLCLPFVVPGVAQAAQDDAEPVPDGYVVAPFQYDGGTVLRGLEWMAALAVPLAEKIEAVPSLRPAYGPGVIDWTTGAFDADKIAKRARDLGARWVISGSYARPNWKSELTLRAWTVEVIDGVPRLRMAGRVSSVGERADVQAQLDALTLQLLGQMRVAVPDESLARLRRRPTKDLYALTLYCRGLLQLHGIGEPRDLKKAEKTFRRVNLIDPKLAEAHRALGMTLLEMGNKTGAASQLAYALDLLPNYYSAQGSLARLYRAEGNSKRALELAEKALETRPYDVDMREMLGELYWESADLDRAQTELEKVVAIAPRSLPARRTLALVYAAKGAMPNLAAELERVQDLAPDDMEVRVDLGSAYQRMGAPEKAIAAYEEVLRRQPRNATVWKLVGDCYRAVRDHEHAIAAYQKVRRLSPEDPRPYFLLGAIYQELGDDVRAEAMFQEAQQFRRYLGEAWTNLGSIAFRRGDLAKANWYLSRAVVRSPTRPKAHYNYALVLSAKKDRDHALDELRVAGDLDPSDAEIHYLAGVIQLRQGRLEEAKREFEEALKRRPDHPDAKHNLALLDDLLERYNGERSASGSR